MNFKESEVKVGKYKFKITDNTLVYDGHIISRNIKIGGSNISCVDLSIKYNKLGEAISASIPYVMYDPECSIENTLDKGDGTVTMIKTLIQYIKQEIPIITRIHFEDKSSIDCATEEEISKGSKNRKKGTNLVPVPLYYFSIAFNGNTWYEKNFNAYQEDDTKHANYRDKINLLESEELKSKMSFEEFLLHSQPPLVIIEELQKYYIKSTTLGDFFKSIPKKDRCRLVRDWISTFMMYFLNGTFHNTDWIIPLNPKIKGGKNKSKKYYLPKGKLKLNRTYKTFGVIDD